MKDRVKQEAVSNMMPMLYQNDKLLMKVVTDVVNYFVNIAIRETIIRVEDSLKNQDLDGE